MNFTQDFSQPSELPLSQCFRYLDHVCFRLFPSPLQATRNKIAYFFFCARMPVYRFALPLKTLSGHVIKNLLTEFSGVSGENIWLWVMKQGPRCARSVDHDPEPNNFPSGPSTQSIRIQYFGFVRHTFIAHDVIEHNQ